MDQTRAETLRSVTSNAQFFCQLVRDFKAHALDIFHQLVGLLLHDLEGFFFIKVLDLKGQFIGNAIVG